MVHGVHSQIGKTSGETTKTSFSGKNRGKPGSMGKSSRCCELVGFGNSGNVVLTGNDVVAGNVAIKQHGRRMKEAKEIKVSFHYFVYHFHENNLVKKESR